MARGPGVMSAPYPSVTLLLADGSTESVSNAGYYTYKFNTSGSDSSKLTTVVLSANAEITYKGKKFRFKEWGLTGIVPDGLNTGAPATTSTPYDEAGGEMLVHIYYEWDDEEDEYGTVVIEPSASPTAGGTVDATVASWTGKVGSSFDSVLTAVESIGYTFLRWSDNGAKTHTITETVLAKGTRYVRPIAYFRQTTGLILRSASSGKILRGRTDRILRDESKGNQNEETHRINHSACRNQRLCIRCHQHRDHRVEHL